MKNWMKYKTEWKIVCQYYRTIFNIPSFLISWKRTAWRQNTFKGNAQSHFFLTFGLKVFKEVIYDFLTTIDYKKEIESFIKYLGCWIESYQCSSFHLLAFIIYWLLHYWIFVGESNKNKNCGFSFNLTYIRSIFDDLDSFNIFMNGITSTTV